MFSKSQAEVIIVRPHSYSQCMCEVWIFSKQGMLKFDINCNKKNKK